LDYPDATDEEIEMRVATAVLNGEMLVVGPEGLVQALVTVSV
jgi:hypothetical protein